MPDVEAPELSLCEEEVSSVGADSWQCSAGINRICLIDHFGRSELMCFLVEGLSVDVVFHIFVPPYEFGVLGASSVGELEVS